MKKIILTIGILFFGVMIYAQSAEEVLQDYFNTIGQAKINKIETMSAVGKSQTMGMEFPFMQLFKRPNMFYLEVDIQGSKMKQVYDGTNAWMVAPWTGSLEPTDITGPQLEAMKIQSDLDGQLYNWKEKGYEMEFKGKEDVDGSEVFTFKLTDKEKNLYTFYIDSESFLLVKMSAKMTIQGNEIISDTYFSNYKEVDGMLLAHSVESKVNGQTQMVAVMEKYSINEKIDNDFFQKPVAK